MLHMEEGLETASLPRFTSVPPPGMHGPAGSSCRVVARFGTQKYSTASSVLGEGMYRHLRGWDGVSSCVFGNRGCCLPLQVVI